MLVNKSAITIRICAINPEQKMYIYMNHPPGLSGHRLRFDSLVTALALRVGKQYRCRDYFDIVRKTMIRLARHSACVSSGRRYLWLLPYLLYLQTAPTWLWNAAPQKWHREISLPGQSVIWWRFCCIVSRSTRTPADKLRATMDIKTMNSNQ